MDIHLLARSLLVGLAVAAPVGPIGILVIRRSLAQGAPAGLATGLGAASADALFALAAALGLTAIATAATPAAAALRAGGGAFLCVLGVRALLRARRGPVGEGDEAGRAPERALVRAFAETLFLTLTSPMTILSFAAVAASLGVGPTQGRSGVADALTLVGGVFAGSTLWWALLSASVSALRRRVPGRAILWLDRASGAVLLAFGLLALARPG